MLCSAQLLTPVASWETRQHQPRGGYLKALRELQEEGKETEEVKIKRPGQCAPGEDKET